MMKGRITFGKINLTGGDKNRINSEEETVGSFGTFSHVEQSLQSSQAERSKNIIHNILEKKAKVYDVEELVKESRKLIEETNKQKLENLRLNEDEIEDKSSDSSSDSDDCKFVSSSHPSEFKQTADITEINVILDNKSSVEKEVYTKKTTDNSDVDNGMLGDDDDDDFIGPPLPPGLSQRVESSDSESESENDEVTLKLPISHELILSHGTKTISAVAIDPSGTRLVSGSLDYDMKCWDFTGMNQSKEPFRTVCPFDGYPVLNVDYSYSGHNILIVTGSQQAKLYNRDGLELFECVRGDMYLHDMAKTKGHIAGLTCGVFHPKDKEEFLTSARDGTCRIWNLYKTVYQTNVIKAKAKTGLKTNPITCCYNKDGLLVVCACDDGSVQMWDHRKNFVATTVNIKDAHTKGTETSGICFSYDNTSFATRGGDDTLKLWDLRNNRQAVHEARNLFNRFSMTDCTFSPNDRVIATGTSLNKGDKFGKVVMFDKSTFDIVHEIEICKTHVVKTVWHPKLNQLTIGCGDGLIRVLYDLELSRNGAVLIAAKHRQRTKHSEIVTSQRVITPHALPLFREERHKSTRKQQEKDRKDPVKSHRPELPLGKLGSGGRVAAGGSTLSSYIIRKMGLKNKVLDEGDPREALLKYAKTAEEDPYWVTPAYSKTQPKPIFNYESEGQPSSKKQKTS